jgi:hypothetical protein
MNIAIILFLLILSCVFFLRIRKMKSEILSLKEKNQRVDSKQEKTDQYHPIGIKERDEILLNFFKESTAKKVEYLNKVRIKYPNAYKSWGKQEITDLKKYFEEGKSASDIAQIMGRSRSGIRSRLIKLGLIKIEEVSDLLQHNVVEEENEAGDEEDDEEDDYIDCLSVVMVCQDCGEEFTYSSDEEEEDEKDLQELDLLDNKEPYCDDPNDPPTIDGHCPKCGGLLLSTDLDK